MKEKVMVSACLLGEKCRYDGKDNQLDSLLVWLEDKEVFPICPEVWGGLSTPRIPSEIYNDKVINQIGEDNTDAFYRGAYRALEIAKKENIKTAILKSKSPSCGSGQIYDGTFTRTLVDGDGICAKLLKKAGIRILNSDDYK